MDVPPPPPGSVPIETSPLPPGATPVAASTPPPPEGSRPIGGESSPPPPPGSVAISDLNAINPQSGMPNWLHAANEEINSLGLDDHGGQVTPQERQLAGDPRKQILAKWEKAAHGDPMQNPEYLAKINQDLTPGQQVYEKTLQAATGLARAGTAPLHLVADMPQLDKNINESTALGGGTFGNQFASGVGAAVPTIATGYMAPSVPAFAAVAGVQNAGEAAAQPGATLPGVVGAGLRGAGEGVLTGKLLGAAQGVVSKVASPVGRALTAGGIDIGGNAALGAGGQVVSNLENGRPLGEGVGVATAVGAATGAAFAPSTVHHAEIARQHERVNQVLGQPAELTQNPRGRDGVAMEEVAKAATGKPAIWYQSDSPRNAFLDPADGRMYVNANTPAEALHEAFHALWRGELKPKLQSFVADHPDVIAQGAENYADRAEAAGEQGIADKVRSNPQTQADEGLAVAGAAAMTPEAIANIAKTNPGAFMRGYERVLGLVDAITGGNSAKGRLVERQAKQFLDPLRANVDVARQKLLQESPAMRDEEMLDRLDPQMTEAARDAQASREQRGAALRRSGEIENEEAMLDRLDPQMTAAAHAGREAEPTQRNAASADELQARPGDKPFEKPAAVDPQAEQERREFEAEDQESARRARVLEYSHDDLRAMSGPQLQRTADAAGVRFDAPSTTIPRILDAQRQSRLAGMNSKQLWDSVRALGLRAGSREENISTLMEAGRQIPAAGRTPQRPPGEEAPAQATPPAATAPLPAESAAGEGPGEPESVRAKTREIVNKNVNSTPKPAETGPEVSTVELRRQARAKGLEFRGTREQVLERLNNSGIPENRKSEGGGGAGEERFSREDLKNAGLPDDVVDKIEANATPGRTKPADRSVEHQGADSRAAPAQAGGGNRAEAGRPSQESGPRQSQSELAAAFYEPEPRAGAQSTNIFGDFAPPKDTGAQNKMQFETEPVKIAPKAAEESEVERRARKVNGGDANQMQMGESQPGGVKVSEDKVKDGRTSFEVSMGDAKLTVEQERPGGKSWRVVRKGQTTGEVSRATSKTLAGALSRAEAQQTAEGILNKGARSKPKAPPDEPQDLRDLPEDDIPFSIKPSPIGRGNQNDPTAEAGAKEEADPKAPLGRRLMGAVQRVIGGAARQVSIDPVPNLTEAGVGDSAIAHASAKIAAPWVVRDMIARSLPETFKDAKAKAELADILLKNRYLGAYDRFKGNDQSAQADAIAKAHDLQAFDKDVKAYWNDPKTRAQVEAYIEHSGQTLNQLYKEAKGAGEIPDFRAPRQGRYFDAYVPIRADIEGAQAAAAENVEDFMPLPANNALNANVRKDKFDKRASYTGDFGTDLEGLLTAVVGPRLNEVTKLRFYKDLLAKGVAIEPTLEQEKPSDIQGKPVASMDVRMPRYDPATGKTTAPERRLFVRADLVREIRDVLDTDQRAPENKMAQLLTKIQVAGLADAAAHGKNMFARLFMSQGSGSHAWDVIKANPAIGVPATIAKLAKTYREISADTPATRAELAEMAQAGLLRSEYEPSKFLEKVANATGWDWMRHLSTGETLHHMDTAARLILNRQYSELVDQGRAPDTAQGRRDFVLRLGNYNRRLMGPWMRTFRDGGFSPFIVAARNYNRSARELLTGNPGFKGADKQQRINARLTQLGMLASLALTAPLVNMVMTGTPGGRDGTPTGAIDFGGDDSDGSHSTWDVLQLAGLRRGLRSTGADSVIEGIRQGKDANTIAGNAVQGISNSALHPWIGPAPSFVFKALTGRQLDIRGKMEAQTIPEGGAKQYLENLRAATESQNPLMYALTRPAFQAAGLDQKPADEEKGFLGGLGSTLAKIPAQAVGLKDARPGKDAAEDMADRLAKAHFGSASMTPEDAGKFALRTSLLSKLKSDPESGQSAIEEAVADGKLSEREAANLHKKAGMSGLAWNVKSLGAADAAKVYEAGTDEEKEALRDTLVDKISGSKELSSGQQDALLEQLGIDPPEDLAMRRELQELGGKARAYQDARKKAQTGDKAARAKLSSLRMSGKDQARLSRLQNLSRAIRKAKGEGPAGASKVKRLVAAA